MKFVYMLWEFLIFEIEFSWGKGLCQLIKKIITFKVVVSKNLIIGDGIKNN